MIKKSSFIAIAIAILMILAGFTLHKADKSDFDKAKEIIVMRDIAHQILRSAGDSSSTIAPVIRISENEFQIPFESSFSFKPGSIVGIIDRVILANGLPSKYIVNVIERKSDKVIYGYARMGPQQKDIVPCLGREQPNMRYYINIRFQESKVYTVRALYTGGIGMFGIGLLLLSFSRYKMGKRRPELMDSMVAAQGEKKVIPLGKYLFYADEQRLKFNDEETILTVKESKILSIFANAPNQVIDRKRLQKEIWEDEGVIVGRSLDMFISRLRKKLENDPDLKIVNIHGKGYKLEISG